MKDAMPETPLDTILENIAFAIEDYHNPDNREKVYNALFRVKAAAETMKNQERLNYIDDSGD